MNRSVILSGGAGERFGSELPKQYHKLMGQEVIAYVIQAFRQSIATDQILIVAGAEQVERLSADYDLPCIAGDIRRNGTVDNALTYIRAHYPECKNVLFHDAARPFITADIADNYYRFLQDYDAVITAQTITDSLGRRDAIILDRENYFLIQTPEAFKFEVLNRYFTADSPATALVQQLPLTCKVKRYFDFPANFKLTYPPDLWYAEQLMKSR
jgi:2-C-methyl-D-erythritol 4-phosphate cytidylyltransferase